MQDNLYFYSFNELQHLLTENGFQKFRAMQLYEWFHNHGITTYSEISNLPANLIDFLTNNYPLPEITIDNCLESRDGTKKYLIKFNDNNCCECVLIPSHDRYTICISSQIGCSIGCKFCATGHSGFIRNLNPFEILSQIFLIQKINNISISNVVLMGQGEPFLNFDNAILACKYINKDKFTNIASRKITVSTSGIIKGIEKFSKVPEQINLAISLHSADQHVRNIIMPNLQNQPLNRLRMACIDYTEKTHRRITFEYMLIKGINDKKDDLQKLIDFCGGLLCHVNLLSYNPIKDCKYKSSSIRNLNMFENALQKNHIPVSIRKSKGSDIAGACGQLANLK